MYRVQTVFSGPTGTPWRNFLHFDASAGTPDDAAAAAGVFWGAVDADMHNTVTWSQEPDVEQIDAETGELVTIHAVTPATGTGGNTNERMPSVNQAIIKLRTGAIIGGRELRGRIFVPGLTEECNSLGVVLAAARTRFNTAAAALIADADCVWTVWHRPTTPAGSDGGQAPVATATANLEWSYLRSRRD